MDAQHRAQLRWEVEANVESYWVERSTDGASYATISKVVSQGDGEHFYSFNKPTSHTGKVYYRIKQVDKDGRASYSQILIVNNQEGDTVTVYPNPSGGMMNLNITDRSLKNTVASKGDSRGVEKSQFRDFFFLNVSIYLSILVNSDMNKKEYFYASLASS